MKGICLCDWQVQALLEGRLKQFTKPLKEQPKSDWSYATTLLDGRAVFDVSNGFDVKFITLPCVKDVQYYVKETWAHRFGRAAYGVIYKQSDASELLRMYDNIPIAWFSPATMPANASRIFVTPTEILVRRVQEISAMEWIDEMDDCLVKNDTKTIWDKQYPKTPWDRNPWVVTYKVDVEVKR